MIIVDEAEQLGPKALATYRSLFVTNEDAGFGLAFVGDLSLPAKIGSIVQLDNRITLRRIINDPTPADVAAILASYGIEGTKAKRFLERIAMGKHGFRGVAKCSRIAFMLAAGAAKPLSHEFIARAWQQLTGGNALAEA